MKNGKRILLVTIKRMSDESPDTSWMGEYGNTARSEYAIDRAHAKCIAQDYDRMEGLNNGEWFFLGIAAEAEVWNPASRVVQRLHSGGLWGIESSEKKYIEEEEHNQLAELRQELKAYGFTTRAISKAFEAVQHKNI